MKPTITVIVCSYNEAFHLPACLHSIRAQTRLPDEVIVVNNASTDETGAVARSIPGIRVLDEPNKGLVIARETVRADAVAWIGGFDRAVEFHGEDTNLARRLTAVGSIEICPECWVWTSARRYRAMGKGHVFALYVRNFWSEILRHRPADREHLDVRM
jgi:glycosyltransferase involved in cell wall biosynthesis